MYNVKFVDWTTLYLHEGYTCVSNVCVQISKRSRQIKLDHANVTDMDAQQNVINFPSGKIFFLTGFKMAKKYDDCRTFLCVASRVCYMCGVKQS